MDFAEHNRKWMTRQIAHLEYERSIHHYALQESGWWWIFNADRRATHRYHKGQLIEVQDRIMKLSRALEQLASSQG